jgi:hypothetical protein
MPGALVCNPRREFHGICAAKLDRGYASGIAALSKSNDRGVIAEAGDVDTHDQGLVAYPRDLAVGAGRGLDQGARNELHRACVREHAFDAHPDEIRVLAVIADPLFELRLVRALDQAAIDVSMIPAMAEPPEAFTEPSAVPGRISES